MNYIELYNKMIKLFQKTDGIRGNLCKFYRIKDEGKTVRNLVEENSNFQNSTDAIKTFIKEFYEFGGITKESFEEFQHFSSGNMKPINRVVFAARNKIDSIVDITFNEVNIISDESNYLIYDIVPYKTLWYKDLLEWWKETQFINLEEYLNERVLSFSTDIEKRFYQSYKCICEKKYKDKKYPALLPQYALKNRSKTIQETGGIRKVIHRIDFAMILEGKVVLIEIDGIEHYSALKYSKYYNSDETKYNNEREIDRNLNLEGYEIYRFGNMDIKIKNDNELNKYLEEFFDKLFDKFNVY